MTTIKLFKNWLKQPFIFRLFSILCCLSSTLLLNNQAFSQTPASCGDVNCTSNDVRVISAYLSGPNNSPIDCSLEHPFANAELHLVVFSNTQRVGVSISGKLNVNGGASQSIFANCFKNQTLNSGGNNNLTLSLPLSNAICGDGFSLTNLFVSWGTGNTDFCEGSTNGHCPATKAKCRFVAGETIPVTVKLDVDFSSMAGVCKDGGDSKTFVFTPELITSKNIVYPVTFTWDFGDGTATQTTSASSLAGVANAKITHTYANEGMYTVTLVGSDASPTAPVFSVSSKHTIDAISCCNLQAPVSGGDQIECASNPVQTLTATATGGLGETITWFDAATGGNEVASPTLNAVGSVTYYAESSTSNCVSPSRTAVTLTIKATPAAPVLEVVDNCDETSTITASGFTGTLTWSDGGTGNPRTVTSTTAVTATQTVNGCVSDASNSVTPAPKTKPTPPHLDVVDNCDGTSTVTASGFAGSLNWSDEGTGNPRIVTSTAALTVTQTVNGCVSDASNSVTPAPKTKPAAPHLEVADNCDETSTITASGFTGTLTWSDGGTGNPRTVTSTTAVTATQTVNGCVSDASNSVTPSPKTKPTPPHLDVVNNCDGTSTVTASGFAGSLNWSDGGTGNPRTVTSTTALTVTQTANGCESDASNSVTPAPKTKPTTGITTGTQTCNGGIAAFSLTATGNGTSFVWSKSNGADGTFSSTTAVSTTYTPGPLDRKNGVVITLTAYLNDCSNSATTTLRTSPCGPYYTYTQGYYSSTGTSCTPTGGLKTSGTSLIQYALDNMDGTLGNNAGQLYLGKAGASFTVNYAEAARLMAIMPGGGTASKLAGNYNLSVPLTTKPNYYPPLKNNKINNVLLSQTVTLALNANIQGDGLKSLILKSGYLTTKKGTGCPVVPGGACSMSSLKITTNATLLNLLNGKTVADLLTMASNALGGTVISGVSLTDINNAVDVINKSFDGGALFLGYFTNAQSCSSASTLSAPITNNVSISVNNAIASTKLAVTAYPNPYSDKVMFTMESPVSGQGSLEVFNAVGQKISTLYKGLVPAGKTPVEYKVPATLKYSMFYVLKVGNAHVTGKLISLKK